ncbi:hypothetical protein MWN34_11320 [Ancylobacter sp. 6x-1]|uniref:LPS-assembly lipoprotein n=1 Tax=Ancylobacter crimeensis TaxID=2579147 RepID=A0ABT0DC18_9HYPH|nr:hypothetical protein [Ancylobacter crimeensis]MCK0197505.1 hypothetical protein [Ancylobacter crimeensis]
MSSPDRTSAGCSATRSARRSFVRRSFGLAAVGLMAIGLAGCFQPMYAESTPGGTDLRQKLQDVEIVFVPGRLGNEVRNDLIFSLTGGAGNPTGAPYRLTLQVTDSSAPVIIDSISGLPQVEMVSLDANWQLSFSSDPAKPIKAGHAFGKASLESGYQRFARARAIRDAQNRAATVVADTIKSQLASYFVTNPNPQPPAPAPATPAVPPKS